MEWISSPEAWAALATLTLLEIVLGVDNIIFISVLVGRLPPRTLMKMMLSTPRTISSNVRVASAAHASGELIHSIAWSARGFD